MTRTDPQSIVSENEVLVHLARSVPYSEAIVQLGATRLWPGGWHDIHPGEVQPEKVGLLHLGPGRHRAFADWEPHLVRGAIVLFENYRPGEAAYDFAAELASRNTVTSLHEARYWKGLGVATYRLGA